MFYIDVIIVGLALAAAILFLDIPRFHRDLNRVGGAEWPKFPGPVDWTGTALILTATILYLAGLQLGGALLSWSSPTSIGLIAAGLTTSTILTVWLMFHQRCIVPGWIFVDRSFIACLVVGFLYGFTQIGCVYYLPLSFQLVLGASAVQSGLWIVIAIVAMLSTTVAVGFALKSTDRYRTIIWMSASSLTLGVGLSMAFTSHWN